MFEEIQNTKEAGLTSAAVLRIAKAYATRQKEVRAFKGDKRKINLISVILEPLQEVTKVAGSESVRFKGPIQSRIAAFDVSVAIGWCLATMRFIPENILVNAVSGVELSKETNDDMLRWADEHVAGDAEFDSIHMWPYFSYLICTRALDGVKIAVAILNEFSIYFPEMLDDALKS